MLFRKNGGVKVVDPAVPVEEVAVVSSDLTMFLLASIIGGNHDAALVTADGILRREVLAFHRWAFLQKIWSPEAAAKFLGMRKLELFNELKRLTAINIIPAGPKEPTNAGDGAGAAIRSEGDREQNSGPGKGGPDLSIA